MSLYEVKYGAKVLKELNRLDKPVRKILFEGIEALKEDPRPQSGKLLVGNPGLRSLRIGVYRVLYRIDDEELIVLPVRIGHRSVVYRDLAAL